MNPTTSLSMIYLREFAKVNSQVPGKVRLARKAMHMLRMHWAHVRQRRLSAWDAVSGVSTLGTGSDRSTASAQGLNGHSRNTGLVSDLRGVRGL